MCCLTWGYKNQHIKERNSQVRWGTCKQGEELVSKKSKHLASEKKNRELTIKQQENYQLFKMQGLLKVLLVCGILLAVVADTQALVVS